MCLPVSAVILSVGKPRRTLPAVLPACHIASRFVGHHGALMPCSMSLVTIAKWETVAQGCSSYRAVMVRYESAQEVAFQWYAWRVRTAAPTLPPLLLVSTPAAVTSARRAFLRVKLLR